METARDEEKPVTIGKAASLPADIIHHIVDDYLPLSRSTTIPHRALYTLNKHWYNALTTSKSANHYHHVVINPVFEDDVPLNERLLRWMIKRMCAGNVNKLSLHVSIYAAQDLVEFGIENLSIFSSLKFNEFTITYDGSEDEDMYEAMEYSELPMVMLPSKLNTKALILDAPKLRTIIYRGRQPSWYFGLSGTFESSPALKSVEVMELRGDMAGEFIKELNAYRLSEALPNLIELVVHCEGRIEVDENAFESFKNSHNKLFNVELTVVNTVKSSEDADRLKFYC